jgi:hypothetical protein
MSAMRLLKELPIILGALAGAGTGLFIGKYVIRREPWDQVGLFVGAFIGLILGGLVSRYPKK